MNRSPQPRSALADIDASFVARPVTGLAPVAVGDELVLLDGWDVATRLNPTGALIWSSLDGEISLGELAADLAKAGGVGEHEVMADLARFVADLAGLGLLEGMEETADGDADIDLEIIPPHGPGDILDDLELRDLDGTARRLSDLTASGTIILVNWSPHCGYCARIAHDLADIQPHLAAAGCKLVLVATGSAQANRALADAAGLDVPILLLAPGHDLFGGAGTPSAYHLDPAGRIVGPPAHGSDQVPALARAVAGVEVGAAPNGPTEQVRYLLERDGLCAPAGGAEDTLAWAGTRVYRLADHHVGIRYDSSATAAVLDCLFAGHRVADPRAGHSFSVSLDLSSAANSRRGVRSLNLLVRAGRPTVRSRDSARVLRALLSQLTDGIVAFDLACGRLQVDAIAVLHRSGAALLPSSLHSFAPRLQPLLARQGIALVDVDHPEIDPVTAELVIPEPAIDHDRSVLDALAVTAAPTSERPLVRAGRHPLTTWCVIHPGAGVATPLSPGEAAAATLSTVLHTEDAPERVRQLGRLFSRVDGFGLWYHSESEVISAVVEALHGDSR